MRWCASLAVELILAAAVVFAVVALFSAAMDVLDATQMSQIDTLAAVWPWLWLVVIISVVLAKFFVTWWSQTPEDRQAMGKGAEDR